MRRAALAALCAATASMCAPGGVVRASAPANSGPAAATASVRGGHAVLADGAVLRRWSVHPGPGGGVATTELVDVATGRNWAAAPSDDFSVTVNGVALSSSSGWGGVGAETATGADGSASLTFTLSDPAALPGSGISLTRTSTLRAGSAVVDTTVTLTDPGPLPLRVGPWSIDSITSRTGGAAEVDAYRGGSDFTDHFRTSSKQTGAFDVEGEVGRFEGTGGAGWFLVSERRGGSASRVTRAATAGIQRTAVGVDPARDLFDAGPETTPGSDDNRVDNPLYPAPIRARTVVPGTSLDLGAADTGVYHGGAPAAAAAFTADLTARIPGVPRSIDQNTFHPFGHGPQMGAATLTPQADASHALGVETFMLDDQWQGSSAGDWTFDPTRFPDTTGDGTPDFVRHLHAIGMNLGLWMSPVEFNKSSAAYNAHPDWACTPTGDATAQLQDASGLGVWDISNPGLRSHMTAVIDHAIAQWGVTEFKFDFMTWLDCPPHDYMDYEDAFVSWVREQEAHHPGVTFELDETNDQRCWPFESVTLGPSWFDNDHTHGSTTVAKQLHDLWSAAPWMPPSSLGLGLFDGTLTAPYSARYLMSISMLGHITMWTDVTTLSAADAAETSWWLSWYAAHRAELAGPVYEDTAADPLDGSSWLALQPWSGTHGYLFAFRQGGGAATQTIALQGLSPRTTYTLTDVRTGAALPSRTGAQLMAGLTVSLGSPYSSEVIAVSPA